MNSDTINLLKECNAGCKSATNSMEQVLPFVKNEELKKSITICNEKHIKIGEGCHAMLNEGGFEERDPNPISKAFAWASVEMKLMIDDKDEKIARLMMDGCNMGIQSLAGYINQYKDADSKAVDKAKELIEVEQDFMKELLIYL
jgi:hypothetical protein